MGDKLLVMTYVDDLLIVGEKLAQESFLAKLSAQFPLKHQTKLDAKTPLTFLGKLVEYNQQEHSISLHLPTAYYQKLFKLYGMEQAKPASTTGDKLGLSVMIQLILSTSLWILQGTSFTEQRWASCFGRLRSDPT